MAETATRNHLSRKFYVRGDSGDKAHVQLRCLGCDWKSDRSLSEHEQRLAHRAHRREMGDTVTGFLKLPQSERLRRLMVLHGPEGGTAGGGCPVCNTSGPCETRKLLNGVPIDPVTGQVEVEQ